MTKHDRGDRRFLGAALIAGTALIALPLTATRADHYVDVAAPAPVAPLAAKVAAIAPLAAPVAALPVAAAVAPVAPVDPLAPAGAVKIDGVSYGPNDINMIGDDYVVINGVRKRWEELTPAERTRIRAEVTKARREVDQQVANLPRMLAETSRSLAQFRDGSYRRQIEEVRKSVRQSLAEVERNAPHLRAAGENPAHISQELRRSLAEVEGIDIDKVTRDALASVDVRKIEADVRGAARSLDEVEAKLDALDRR